MRPAFEPSLPPEVNGHAMGYFKKLEAARDEEIREFLNRGGKITKLPNGPASVERDLDNSAGVREAAKEAWQRRLAWLARQAMVAHDRLERLQRPSWKPDKLDRKMMGHRRKKQRGESKTVVN